MRLALRLQGALIIDRWGVIMSKKEVKYRNCACIIYPESCPDDFIGIIRSWQVPAFLSPLHSPDDEQKKPHYHLLVLLSGQHVEQYYRDLFSSIGGVGCLRVRDKTAYIRYLCHLDQPDKEQLNINDVVSFGGLDYSILCKNCVSDVYTVFDILKMINDYRISNFAELVDMCVSNNLGMLDTLLSKSSVIILVKEYIRDNNKRMYLSEYSKVKGEFYDC